MLVIYSAMSDVSRRISRGDVGFNHRPGIHLRQPGVQVHRGPGRDCGDHRRCGRWNRGQALLRTVGKPGPRGGPARRANRGHHILRVETSPSPDEVPSPSLPATTQEERDRPYRCPDRGRGQCSATACPVSMSRLVTRCRSRATPAKTAPSHVRNNHAAPLYASLPQDCQRLSCGGSRALFGLRRQFLMSLTFPQGE